MMGQVHRWWWKYLSIGLLLYVVLFGLLGPVPRISILNETIRVLYFHVPMWFGMIFLLAASLVYAIKYLSGNDPVHDLASVELANVGVFLGMMGICTGMVWANFTWGAPWTNDPKLNGSAVGLLIYLAYFILRGSLPDSQQKARISAVYNIFSFAALIPLLFILPRLTDSLHPGNGGNPGFNAYDLNSNLRLVFYPAVIGWALLGFWIASLRFRTRVLELKMEEEQF